MAGNDRPKVKGNYTTLYDAQTAGLSSAGASGLQTRVYTLLTRFANGDGVCWLSIGYAEGVLGSRRQSIESALKALTGKTFPTDDERQVPVLTKLKGGRHGRCATYRDNLLLYAAGEMDSLPHIAQRNTGEDATSSLHAGDMDSLQPCNELLALYKNYKMNKKRGDGAGAPGTCEPGAARAEGGDAAGLFAEFEGEELLAEFKRLADDPQLRIDADKRSLFHDLEKHLRGVFGNEAVNAVVRKNAAPSLPSREQDNGGRQ